MMIYQENIHLAEDSSSQFASYVRRIGSPVSTSLIDSACQTFTVPEIDGIIGYYQHKNCIVVIGDPICLENQKEKLATAFQQFCRKNNLSLVYFFATETFAHWAIHNGCKILIQAGEELILDPTTYKKTQKIRWKVNHSTNHGVQIHEYLQKDPLLEEKLNQLLENWLKAKKGPQIHLGNLDHLKTSTQNRIFYAIQGDKLLGLLVLLPVERFNGWVISSFISLDSTVGSGEHLMSTVIETLSNENCHFLCIGGAAGSAVGEIIGLNGIFKYLIKFFYTASKWLFHLEAKSTYLHKYHPRILPTYIVAADKLGIDELLAIKKILHVKIID